MRVLLVEDEARLARGLRIGLEREGSAVDVASDGQEGLWFARENEYDVVLLDVMLPGIDGHEVCRQLRSDGNWTPVLMLTARDRDLDQIQGLDSGADDYVLKPFNFDVLLARMRSLVRRGAGERPTTLAIGDLVLDPATRTVARAGRAIDLSPREFSLLEFLMRHRGAVVTKRQIMANLWDFDFAGDSNTVEVFIARLRKKVDRPFGTHDIETSRGNGYRMRTEP